MSTSAPATDRTTRSRGGIVLQWATVGSLLLAVGGLLHASIFGGTASVTQRVNSHDSELKDHDGRIIRLEGQRQADDKATENAARQADRRHDELLQQLRRIEDRLK